MNCCRQLASSDLPARRHLANIVFVLFDCLLMPAYASFLPLLQEELVYLKALWDQTAAVLHTFKAWSGMLWDDINVEALMEECKQLTKDIKHLPKTVSRMRQTCSMAVA